MIHPLTPCHQPCCYLMAGGVHITMLWCAHITPCGSSHSPGLRGLVTCSRGCPETPAPEAPAQSFSFSGTWQMERCTFWTLISVFSLCFLLDLPFFPANWKRTFPFGKELFKEIFHFTVSVDLYFSHKAFLPTSLDCPLLPFTFTVSPAMWHSLFLNAKNKKDKKILSSCGGWAVLSLICRENKGKQNKEEEAITENISSLSSLKGM